jgi:hypothetical protein
MTEEAKVVQEVAKAAQEAAKTTNKLVHVIEALGHWVGEAISDLPSNLVGVVGADWLREHRIRQIDKLRRRTEEIIKERGKKYAPREPNPSFLVPIFNSACDDSRIEIQELWARLIASAIDGNRPNIRKSFISIINQMDEFDAIILQRLSKVINLSAQIVIEKQKTSNSQYYSMAEELNMTKDQWEISMDQLSALGIIAIKRDHIKLPEGGLAYYTQLSALGREFINACKI